MCVHIRAEGGGTLAGLGSYVVDPGHHLTPGKYQCYLDWGWVGQFTVSLTNPAGPSSILCLGTDPEHSMGFCLLAEPAVEKGRPSFQVPTVQCSQLCLAVTTVSLAHSWHS